MIIAPVCSSQVMKLYAWEPPFEKKVLEARRLEVMELRKTAVLNALITLCWVVSPALVIRYHASFLFFFLFLKVFENTLSPVLALSISRESLYNACVLTCLYSLQGYFTIVSD